ncbi:autotransporter outer membrane beta-barrel domain-containing protein [Brucella sp. BE17]|uniref:autotransporter family protein n=1 Tax=Brucella sp. BE17 TaxID=3142977 RepID=UPI0031BABDB5
MTNWNGSSLPQNGANSVVTINSLEHNPSVATGVSFTGRTLNIATDAATSGALELKGNSAFQLQGVNVGSLGSGKLTIADSTLTSVGSVTVGSTGYGEITVSGADAKLSITGISSHLNIGNRANGHGRVEIRAGATLETSNVSLGNLTGAGDLIVNGSGSKLVINSRDLSAVGRTGNVTIEVSDGGLIDIKGDPTNPDTRGLLQLGSNAGTMTDLLITGENSQVTTTGNGLIAEFGRVNARVENKGLLDIGNHLLVGIGVGDLNISGNSIVKAAGDTVIGYNLGRGVVTVRDNSRLISGGEIYIAQGDNTLGILNIGGTADAAAAQAGFLEVAAIHFGTGDGRLVFNHTADTQSGAYEFTQQLDGAGAIEHYSGLTRFSSPDNAAFTGTTHVFGGTMRIDGALGGAITVEENGRLQGIGSVGSVHNHGVIAPGNSIGTLTINGDYIGRGGFLEVEAVLGNDNSLTDRLVVTGNTSGETNVVVKNVGGTGMATTEGIRIIEVGGNSEGNFSLLSDYIHNGENAVVAGAHAYKLRQGSASSSDDGDWYLRSEVQTVDPIDPTDPVNPTDPIDPAEPVDPVSPPSKPLYQAGVPTYESYAQSLLGLNGVSTLQQRVGNRLWAGYGNRVVAQGSDPVGTPYAAPEEAGVAIDGNGVWGRIEGAHNSIKPRFTTSSTDYDQNILKLQAGLDSMLAETESGKLIGGVTVHYAHGKTKTRSVHGDGEISTDGYGFGGTLTWYGENGFYLDGQAQATWYRSDLSSTLANATLVDGNDGFGYAMSLEGGKRIAIDPLWSLTPQAQLVYSSIDFDAFTDTFGSRVSIDRGDSLQGRLGLTLDHESSWQNANGQLDRAHVYGIANLYYELLKGTKVDVAGVSFASEQDRLWGGLGIGGSYNWNDDKYSIYGEGVVNTSLNNFGDSYSVKGQAGFRVKW